MITIQKHTPFMIVASTLLLLIVVAVASIVVSIGHTTNASAATTCVSEGKEVEGYIATNSSGNSYCKRTYNVGDSCSANNQEGTFQLSDNASDNFFQTNDKKGLKCVASTSNVSASDTACTKENYKSVAAGCVTKTGKPCDPGSTPDGGCWLAKSTTSSTSTQPTGTSTATGGASTTPTNNCKRSGDTGTDLNSYLDACGGRQEIRVNKARADQGEKVPAIILVHGGGWFSDDGNFSPSFQKRMAKWGFTTMRIKYRLMPGGVQEQLWDVQRAIRHVRLNADKYGIDKNRIAVWGDSAGGSLAVRAGASGTTNVKAAVGWSAPTNAFRDLFNSYDGWIAGLYHSRCVGSQLPAASVDVASAFLRGDINGALATISANYKPTPEQSARMLNNALKLTNFSLTEFPGIAGRLKESGSSTLGYTVDQALIDGTEATDDKKEGSIDTEAVKNELKKLDAKELAAVGIAVYQFTVNAQGISTQDEKTAETLSLITNVANSLTQAQKEIQQEKATTGDTSEGTGSTNPQADSIVSKIFTDSNVKDVNSLVTAGAQGGEIITDTANALGINTQIAPAQKIADCIDDFIDMSPALYASPRSPKMFLAGGAKERWVNPLDAYQMRDKLRSMGISSDALILPLTNAKNVYKTNADGHMGYDQRAEVPTLTWLHNLLRSKTDTQRDKEIAERKAAEARKAAAAAAAAQQQTASSSQSGSTGDGGYTSGYDCLDGNTCGNTHRSGGSSVGNDSSYDCLDGNTCRGQSKSQVGVPCNFTYTVTQFGNTTTKTASGTTGSDGKCHAQLN